MSYGCHNRPAFKRSHFAQDGWWVDAGPTWYDMPTIHTQDKVVSLNARPEWTDHGLAWTDVTDKQSNSVVFADFGKDADK